MAADPETQRAQLEDERDHLLLRIDELTVGGKVEQDFDADFADRGQVAGEIGENLTLADALEKQLALVNGALGRIDEGTYGVCSVCGKPIEPERLEAITATDRCIEHA